ncbi:MAG: flippase-like domain-containing protein [Armatimonadetes bacterium]|nr:flippase-like domain-containing protein [Armatimonadota bacterium]
MIRRWLPVLLVIAFVAVVVGRLTEIEHLLEALRQGQWQWVLTAALLQGAYYAAYAALFHAAFKVVEVDGRWRDLLPVLLASLLINTLAPSGGTAGSALFVDDAARRRQSPARALAGTMLVRVADACAFTAILVVGLVHLFLRHHLEPYEITGAALLLLGTAGLAGVLLLGLWWPTQLRRGLGWIERTGARLGGWLRHPSPLRPGWAERNTDEFTRAGAAIGARPRRLGRPLGIALAAHLVDLVSLYALFLAFRQPIAPGALVAGYSMGILFWKMSPIPEGVGVVEGIMILVFVSLGVPAPQATIIALAFRGLTFWLPMVFGFFMVRRLRLFSQGGLR